VEFWEAQTYWVSQGAGALHLVKSIVATALAIAIWRPAWARLACAGLSLLALLEVVASFPESANHHYLQFLCLALMGAIGLRGDSTPLLVGGMRWIGAIGLFHAGWQKLLHGYYTSGTFLAYAIASNQRFSDFFAWVAPAGEVERLRALTFGAGAGPYVIESTWFRTVAQITWAAELVLPPLLLFERTRRLGVAATLAYILAIELGAREIFFAGLIVNLIAFWAPGNLNRKLLPWFFAMYALALLSTIGAIPHWGFT
jgi:hypothetical protein